MTNALETLLALPRFATSGSAAYHPGLDRMRDLLARMSDPQRSFPAIHIAGTNGKGSTASLVASILSASGLRVGLHTSPHLFDLTERMRVGGAPAPHDWLAAATERHRDAFAAVRPSFFEATVALSFAYFAEQAVDIAVVEVGLGGRLDATNVLEADGLLACGITRIGLDHTDLLGETLAEIAREKAGIVKRGVPVAAAGGEAAVEAALREVAAEREAALHLLDEETRAEIAAVEADGLTLDLTTPVRAYAALRVGLAGVHQAENAALAVRLAEIAWPSVTESAIRAGCAEVRAQSGLRARLEVVQASPLVLLDVGHNSDGVGAALKFARSQSSGKLTVALGSMRDKPLAPLVPLLRGAGATVVPVRLGGERARSAEHLGAELRALGVRTEPANEIGAAWNLFQRRADPSDAFLATGSHLVAEAFGRALSE